MEKRKMGNPGVDVSLLGFGYMRFPILADGNINEPEAEIILDKAYKSGINYFDTAFPYLGGKSEPFTGRFLNRYPRDSYYLATRLARAAFGLRM